MTRMQEKTYIITHIPKTAGTTIRIHLQEHMIDQVEFIHLANKGHKWASEKGLKPYPERLAEERHKAKVIFGHQVNYQTKTLVENNQVIEVVYFRNPKDWEISRFNQYNNHKFNENEATIDFQTWATQVEKTHSQFDWFLNNYLCLKGESKYLSATAKLHLLESSLLNFHHVYFTHNFDFTSQLLFQSLGIQAAPKKQNVVGLHKKQYFIDNSENSVLLQNLVAKENEIYERIKNKYDR